MLILPEVGVAIMFGMLSKQLKSTYALQTKSSKSKAPEKSLLRTWWFYAIIVALVYLFAYWLIKPIASVDLASLVESFQFVAFAAASALVFAIVAHKFNWLSTKTGQAMTTLSIGFTLYMIAEASYLVLSLSNPNVPVPSIADVFWILAYVPFAVAFALTIRTIRMKFTRPMLGLWIVLSAATFIVVLAIVVVPIIGAASGSEAMSTYVSMVYPFEDVVIIVLVLAILLKIMSGEVAKPWAVLILGFLMTAIGDIWFGYATYLGNYAPAYDPVDFFLSLGYLASIAAGLLFTRLYGSK
jgi:hypothetical protein